MAVIQITTEEVTVSVAVDLVELEVLLLFENERNNRP